MSRKRIIQASLVASGLIAALALVVPISSALAADCATPWSSATAYNGGANVSYGGHNWSARWWTQNQTPSSTSDVWSDQGTCGSGPAPAPSATPGPGQGCSYPAWVAGHSYAVGDIVTYNGGLYRATHDNPGYDPVISTWFWTPYTCGNPTPPQPTPTQPNPPVPSPGFVVSEAQFNQMFPSRNPFYTYAGLTAALSAYPAFATSGSDTVRKQEAAAFLANVSHETGGLVYVVEQDRSGNYCDSSRPYGCPAGQSAYYGRGPIQLSWNFNYKAAGDALGINLLSSPSLVETDSAVAWKTGLWYWNTQTGPGTMTSHDAMVNGRGFGETIRSINGTLECNGGNPAQVQSRISAYQQIVQILGTTAGGNLSC